MIAFETFLPVRLSELLGGSRRRLGGHRTGGRHRLGRVCRRRSALAGLGRRVIGVAWTALVARVLNGGFVVLMGLPPVRSGCSRPTCVAYGMHGVTNPVHATLLHRQAVPANRATVLSINSMVGQGCHCIGVLLLFPLAEPPRPRLSRSSSPAPSASSARCSTGRHCASERQRCSKAPSRPASGAGSAHRRAHPSAERTWSVPEVRLLRTFRRSPTDFLDSCWPRGADRAPLRVGTESVLLVDDAHDVSGAADHARPAYGEGPRTRTRPPAARPRPADQRGRDPPTAPPRPPAGVHRAADQRLPAVLRPRRTAHHRPVDRGWRHPPRRRDVGLDPGRGRSGAVRHRPPWFGAADHPGADDAAGRLPARHAARRAQPAPLAAARGGPRARRPGRARGGREDRLRATADSPAAPVLELLAASPDLTDTDVRDEVMTLLLAGHETTAMALTWTLAAIDAAPEVRAKLEGEWDAASGLGDSLPLTLAVLAESLRLWPPSWMFSRRVLDPVTLGGGTVPAGTMCLISPAHAASRPEMVERARPVPARAVAAAGRGRPSTASTRRLRASRAAPICPSVLDRGCASVSSSPGPRPRRCWPSWVAVGASTSRTHR